MLTQLIALACLFVQVAHGYPGFASFIPNGAAETREGSGITCAALGHNMCIGGTDRNKFGLDFKAAGLQWTKELCEKDSDGDGLTNGQELGDPCCKWTPENGYELRKAKLSHPGNASDTNTAPKTCPASTPAPTMKPPTPTTTPTPTPTPEPPMPTKQPPPASESTCAAGFSPLNQPNCYFVVFRRSNRFGKYSRSVSIVINRLRFVARVNVIGMPPVDIKRVNITVNGKTTMRYNNKKLNSVIAQTEDLITAIPTAPGKKTCCGRSNGLPIAITIRFCLRSNSKTCFNATFSGKTNIRCVNVCKGKRGRILVMKAFRKCAICRSA